MSQTLAAVIVGVVMAGLILAICVPVVRLRGRAIESPTWVAATETRTPPQPLGPPDPVTAFLWTPIGAVTLAIISILLAVFVAWPAAWIVGLAYVWLTGISNRHEGRYFWDGSWVWAVLFFGLLAYLPWSIVRHRDSPS